MTIKKLNKIKKSFRWKTMQGEVLTLDEMDTKHVFNSLKMCYNHLADRFNKPVFWFNNKYSDYIDMAIHDPDKLALICVVFLLEIEKRTDLPIKYNWIYRKIKENITGIEVKDLYNYINWPDSFLVSKFCNLIERF
jgi:hypothetical protein